MRPKGITQFGPLAGMAALLGAARATDRGCSMGVRPPPGSAPEAAPGPKGSEYERRAAQGEMVVVGTLLTCFGPRPEEVPPAVWTRMQEVARRDRQRVVSRYPQLAGVVRAFRAWLAAQPAPVDRAAMRAYFGFPPDPAPDPGPPPPSAPPPVLVLAGDEPTAPPGDVPGPHPTT